MSERRRQGQGDNVVRLDCARFEDALAEGHLDGRALEHQASCPRCRALARELEAIGALVAGATGPRSVPDDFADRVFARADWLDARADAQGARVDADAPKRRSGRSVPWLATIGIAVAVSLAVVVVGRMIPTPQNAEPTRVSKSAAPATPVSHVAASPSQSAVASSATRPVRLHLAPAPRPKVTPTIPAAQPIPKPSVDLGAELKAALMREIHRENGCPAHAKAPVRITVTVEPSGTLTDREVLSAAVAMDAHRCVTQALDKLLLPPLDSALTITLDVSW